MTGKGAGLSSEGLTKKIAVIDAAIALHRPDVEGGHIEIDPQGHVDEGHRRGRAGALPQSHAQLQQGGGRAVYLAAMESSGPEAEARIQRHRAMRARHGAEAGLDFVTIERPTGIGGAPVRPGDFVLLEDLGNLLANEIWSPTGSGPENAPAHILVCRCRCRRKPG